MGRIRRVGDIRWRICNSSGAPACNWLERLDGVPIGCLDFFCESCACVRRTYCRDFVCPASWIRSSLHFPGILLRFSCLVSAVGLDASLSSDAPPQPGQEVRMLLPDWLDGVRQQLYPRWFSRTARRRRWRLRKRCGAGHSIVPACVEILESRLLLAAPTRITPDSTPPAIAQLAVADYTSSHFGALVHIVQTGPGDVVFVDRLGNMVQGASIDSANVLAHGYGDETTTFSSGIVT